MIDFVPHNKIYKLLLTKIIMTIKNEQLVKDKTIVTPRYISQLKNTKNNYSSLVLERLVNKNVLRKIKRGKYTSSTNLYAIATNLIFPSYISFWSGIAYKGKTEQILSTIFVACTKKTRNIEFEGYKIIFVKLSKRNFFGYRKEIAGNEELFIANNEKLLIDCLLFPRYSGNIDEVIKLVESTEFNQDILMNYLKIINNNSLNQKIGFLLEKYKNINLKLNIKTKNYLRLPIKSKLKINKKWRIKFNDN